MERAEQVNVLSLGGRNWGGRNWGGRTWTARFSNGAANRPKVIGSAVVCKRVKKGI